MRLDNALQFPLERRIVAGDDDAQGSVLLLDVSVPDDHAHQVGEIGV
jgi:hypothetical protein